NETLKRERAMYQDLYRELCDYIQPHRARFFLTDRQNQPRRPGKIINSRPLHAARVLASGMQAGLTSPSSPWFKLLLRDRDLMNYGPVKTWLYQVEEIMRLQFLKSNLYNCFYNIYMDLPTFGIAALHIERDWKDGLRGYNLPV